MGDEQSDIYRNAGEVTDAAQEFFDNGGQPEEGYVAIAYKCKPELMDGEVLFRFVEETSEAIYLEFESTVS